MQTGYWTLLKWGCLALSIGSIFVAGLLMWINDKPIVADSTEQVAEGDKPQANVEKPLIVERKGERIVWRLQAESAIQQEQGMRLVEPRLELFTDKGEAIPIRASEALFEPAARNIRFKGSSQVEFREWTLQSDQLKYDSGRDEVVIPGAFSLSKPGTRLSGIGLRVEHKSERLIIEHKARAEDRVYIRAGGSTGQSVTITSDSLMVDHRRSMAEFSQAVHLKRDDFELHSDRLTVLYKQDGGGEIEQAEAFGNVVMQQREKQGSAERAIYRQKENELIMIGDAEVKDSSGTVQGHRLIHHIDTLVTTVEQGESGTRARMVIEEERIQQ